MEAITYLKSRKADACAVLNIDAKNFGAHIKSASAEELSELATSLGWVATKVETPEFTLEGSETFTAAGGVVVGYQLRTVKRVSTTRYGFLITCEFGDAEIILQKAGRLESLIRELKDPQALVGMQLPVITTGELAMTPRPAFNGVPQFNGVCLEDASEDLAAWKQFRNEEKARFALLSRSAQKLVIKQNAEEQVKEHKASSERAKASVLAAFRK